MKRLMFLVGLVMWAQGLAAMLFLLAIILGLVPWVPQPDPAGAWLYLAGLLGSMGWCFLAALLQAWSNEAEAQAGVQS